LVTVVPEPQCGISDYVSACMSSADLAAAGNQETAGAMIVNLTAVSTYTIPHILYGRTNHTDLQGTLAYSRCITPTPSPTPSGSPVPLTSTPTSWRYFTRDSKGKVSTVTTATLSTPSPPKKMLYYIGFQTTVQESDGKAQVFTALPIVGFLLAGISAWTQLTPSVTRSTTNVVTYPSPSPGAPIPPGGYVGQSTTLNSKVTNPAQINGLATSFLGSSLTYDQAVESVPTADLQGLNAARNLVGRFVSVLKCPVGDATPEPGPTYSPTPTPPSPDSAPATDYMTPACLDILRGNDITLAQTTEPVIFQTIPRPLRIPAVP
jgi:hypothetical protein